MGRTTQVGCVPHLQCAIVLEYQLVLALQGRPRFDTQTVEE